MHDLFLYRKEQAHNLATKRTNNLKVLGTELVLFFTRDFGVNVHRYRHEIVIIVEVIQLGLVVQVDFKNVILCLIISLI